MREQKRRVVALFQLLELPPAIHWMSNFNFRSRAYRRGQSALCVGHHQKYESDAAVALSTDSYLLVDGFS